MDLPLAFVTLRGLPLWPVSYVTRRDYRYVVVELFVEGHFVLGAPLVAWRPRGRVSAGLMRFLMRQVVVDGLLDAGVHFTLISSHGSSSSTVRARRLVQALV